MTNELHRKAPKGQKKKYLFKTLKSTKFFQARARGRASRVRATKFFQARVGVRASRVRAT